jgi:hypothetical protein
VGKLNAPEEYVRLVLAHMWECKRQLDAASVRRGVTGEGRAPNYRIEYPGDAENWPSVFGVYSGLSHKKIDDLGQASAIDLDAIVGKNNPIPISSFQTVP